jgi:hypothetical protein
MTRHPKVIYTHVLQAQNFLNVFNKLKCAIQQILICQQAQLSMEIAAVLHKCGMSGSKYTNAVIIWNDVTLNKTSNWNALRNFYHFPSSSHVLAMFYLRMTTHH